MYICIYMAYLNTAPYVTAGNLEKCVAVHLSTSNFTPHFLNMSSKCRALLYLHGYNIGGNMGNCNNIIFAS